MEQKKEIREIIQEKFEIKLDAYSNILPKPYFKCMKDTFKGLFSTFSPIVSRIAKNIPGSVTNKKKEERVAYHLKSKVNFDKLCEAHMQKESKSITSENLIIIDESDIIKPQANKMQNMARVS